MSKSLGNFVTVDELLKDWPSEVVRFSMLKTHYRQPIDWTARAMEDSHVALRTFATWAKNPTRDVEPSAEFLEALADDLNTPRAIAELHRLVSTARQAATSLAERGPGARLALLTDADTLAAMQLTRSLQLIGIDIRAYDRDWFERRSTVNIEKIEPPKEKIEALITARNAARAAKNWAESDRIRDELAAMGIQLKDSKGADGQTVTTWEVKR